MIYSVDKKIKKPTVMIHYNRVSECVDVGERFKYETCNLFNYRGELGDNNIVILGRHFYQADQIWEIQNFLRHYHEDIVGVVICDDKNYGSRFGDSIPFFELNRVPILALWDRLITDEQIRRMEVVIDGKIR